MTEIPLRDKFLSLKKFIGKDKVRMNFKRRAVGEVVRAEKINTLKRRRNHLCFIQSVSRINFKYARVNVKMMQTQQLSSMLSTIIFSIVVLY